MTTAPTDHKDNSAPLSVHSNSLPALLAELGACVFVSTYQAGKLIILRAESGGLLNTHFRTFRTPMGLAVDPRRLALGTANAIQTFHNQPSAAGKLEPGGKYDACYLPSHTQV